MISLDILKSLNKKINVNKKLLNECHGDSYEEIK